jgi:hypothetical protein
MMPSIQEILLVLGVRGVAGRFFFVINVVQDTEIYNRKIQVLQNEIEIVDHV